MRTPFTLRSTLFVLGAALALPAAAQTNAQLQAQIDELKTIVAQQQRTIASLDREVRQVKLQLDLGINFLDKRLDRAIGEINQLKDKTQFISVVGNDTIFAGTNVWIQNGTGGAGANSLGNLIMGYNPLREAGNVRTGSHNIILGVEANYAGVHSLIGGVRNSVRGDFSLVLTGNRNRISDHEAVIVTGNRNMIGNFDGSYTFGSFILSGQENHVYWSLNAGILSGFKNTVTQPGAVFGTGSNQGTPASFEFKTK